MINVEKIREQINKELLVWDQPGLSVGVIKDNEVILAEGFGFADKENGKMADADTKYHIGSCSKSFTAAAAAVLVDQGKITWDTPVREYLPWIKFQDDFTSANVTMRDLLCHRTGLPRHDAYWIDGPCTREDMVKNLANMQPCWSFRSHWCYQNTCIVAAGMVIEAVSGMTWEAFVKEYVLDPIGMTRTSFYVEELKNDENHAEPYDRLLPTDMNGYHKIPFLLSDVEDFSKGIGAPYGPAGSITSTVNDMLKWVQFNLNKGKVGDKQIISEACMNEIHKPQMLMSEPLLVPFPEQDFYSYGLCWFTETYRGHMVAEHGGNINGFSALETLLFDENLGIVVLVNFNDAFETYAITNEIMDMALEAESGDWHNRYRDVINQVFGTYDDQMAAMRGEQVMNTTPSHDLDAYVGTYRNATYGDVQISKNENGLTFLYNKKNSDLKHFHYDTFTITDPHALFAGMNLMFSANKNGKVNELTFDVVLNPAAKPEIFTKVEA